MRDGYYTPQDRKITDKPRIEINAYAQPLANFRDNFCAAVMNLTPDEVKIIKACASAIQKLRDGKINTMVIQIPVQQGAYLQDAYSFGDQGTPARSPGDDVKLNESQLNGRGQITDRERELYDDVRSGRVPRSYPAQQAALYGDTLANEQAITDILNAQSKGALMSETSRAALNRLLRLQGYPLDEIKMMNAETMDYVTEITPRFICVNGHPLKSGTAWCNRCSAKDRAKAEEQRRNTVNDATTSRFGNLDFE